MSNKNDDWVTEWWWFLVGVVPFIAIIATLSKCTDLSCMLSSFILPAGYGLYRAAAAAIRSHRANAPYRAAARAERREAAAHATRLRAEQESQQEQRNTENRRAEEEKAKQTKSERSVKEAQAKVEEFYVAHRELLQDDFPSHLFHASLKSEIPDDSSTERAWAAARTLIAQLVKLAADRKQEIVQEEKQKGPGAQGGTVLRPRINPEDV